MKARLPEVMAQIAAIGFGGFETALDCLPLDEPGTFHEASTRANGLVICGRRTLSAWTGDQASAAQRKPRLPVALSGVFALRAATR